MHKIIRCISEKTIRFGIVTPRCRRIRSLHHSRRTPWPPPRRKNRSGGGLSITSESRARTKLSKKKIDFTFIGGPSYSKDTQFSLAVMAAGLYRLDRTDSLTPPSDITAFITGGTTGFYMVGINGNNIFSHNRTEFRTSSPSTRSRPTTGVSAIRPERIIPKGRTSKKRYDVDVRYLYQVVPNMFIGASVNFRNSRGIKFTGRNISRAKTRRTRLRASVRSWSTIQGISFQIPTRDFI